MSFDIFTHLIQILAAISVILICSKIANGQSSNSLKNASKWAVITAFVMLFSEALVLWSANNTALASNIHDLVDASWCGLMIYITFETQRKESP